MDGAVTFGPGRLFEAARRMGDTAMGEDNREQIPDSAAIVPALDTQHTGVKGVRGSGHPAWPCDHKETTQPTKPMALTCKAGDHSSPQRAQEEQTSRDSLRVQLA